MRVEDLYRARVPADAEARLLEDLRWLGLDWDEGPDRGGPVGPYRQSERTAHYDAAIARLLASGRAFPCACSRADVARAASAPHAADEDGPRYPGTCRGLTAAEVEARAAAQGRAPAIRFDGRGEAFYFYDQLHGAVATGPGGVDDFVLRRAGGTVYELRPAPRASAVGAPVTAQVRRVEWVRDLDEDGLVVVEIDAHNGDPTRSFVLEPPRLVARSAVGGPPYELALDSALAS